ncbi:uncharacterized protein LOC143209932 [Lasioglossum baleicum]|uniref:uncharacterized protein LOC143209932 n=1 Tax=Lasioglossum baleicum TaxID=434251 RepID=UPI003FCE7040
MIMSSNRCTCLKCLHPVCPHPDAQLPYDEVSHEVGESILAVRIPKRQRQFERSDESNELQQKLSFEFDCPDAEDETNCKPGCTKVHVVPDKTPPPKTADEESFSLRAQRQILYNDDLKNTLEIEFKAPRNYIPLAGVGPPPPIIIPKVLSRKRAKSKAGRKGRSKTTSSPKRKK